MVGRRRGRAKQKFFHWNDLSEMDTSTDEDANVDVPHVSSTKGKGKQKGKSTVRITKKGKLGMISEMPLDVLYEIFFFLSPRDLVRMSWTNKEFRRILTSRVTRNIWRAALESIEGLPQCPTHMNEIEYSTVLFCPTCYGCGRARPPVNWCFRKRICKKCLPDLVYTGEQMWDKVIDAGLGDALAMVRLGDSLELGGFLGYDFLKIEQGRSGRTLVTLRDDVHEFIDACRRVTNAGKDLYEVVKEYGAKAQSRRAHMKAIEPWEEDQAFDREDTLDHGRSKRYQQILEKLEDEGWGTELRTYPGVYDGLKHQPGVKVSKMLTNKGWEHVKGSLITYLEEKKEMRLVAERMERKKQRIKNLGEKVLEFRRANLTPRDFFPTLGSITDLPQINEVLDVDDDEVFEDLKNGITEQLPKITSRIRKAREKALSNLLPQNYARSPTPLKLATTWFSNGIAGHAGRAEDMINEMWGFMVREAWDRVSVDGGIRWSSLIPRIVFQEGIMVAVTKLIVDLGIGNPEEITAEELDGVDCRVVVFSKDPKAPVLHMEVGGWRYLVQKVYRGLDLTDWRVLEDDELPEVTATGQSPVGQLWDCVHCWRAGAEFKPLGPDSVVMHLLEVHAIAEDPVEDVDYWVETARGQNFDRRSEEDESEERNSENSDPLSSEAE